LHGHNYTVSCDIKIRDQTNDLGFTGDYNILKRHVRSLCKDLDEYVLLPLHSPYLEILERDTNIVVSFGEEQFSFPRSDVILLPIKNIILEELSEYLIQTLVTNSLEDILQLSVEEISMTVASNNGTSVTRTKSVLDIA